MGTGYIGMVFLLLLAARRASCSCYPILKEGREARPLNTCSRSKCDSVVGISYKPCYYSGSTCYNILDADVLERVHKACVDVSPPPPPGVLHCPSVVSDTFAYLKIGCINVPVFDPCKKVYSKNHEFALTHVWTTSNTSNKCVCQIKAYTTQIISVRGLNLYNGDPYEEGRSIKVELQANGQRVHTIFLEKQRKLYSSYLRRFSHVDNAWFYFKGQRPARQLMHFTSPGPEQFTIFCPPDNFAPGTEGALRNNGDQGSGNNGDQGSGKNDEEGSGKSDEDGSRDKADSRKKETTTEDSTSSTSSSTQRGKGRFYLGSDGEYEASRSGMSKKTIMVLAIILPMVMVTFILLAFAAYLHNKRKKREKEEQEVTSDAATAVSQPEYTVQSQASDFSLATKTSTASVTENTSTAESFSQAPPTQVTGPEGTSPSPAASTHSKVVQ